MRAYVRMHVCVHAYACLKAMIKSPNPPHTCCQRQDWPGKLYIISKSSSVTIFGLPCTRRHARTQRLLPSALCQDLIVHPSMVSARVPATPVWGPPRAALPHPQKQLPRDRQQRSTNPTPTNAMRVCQPILLPCLVLLWVLQRM